MAAPRHTGKLYNVNSNLNAWYAAYMERIAAVLCAVYARLCSIAAGGVMMVS